VDAAAAVWSELEGAVQRSMDEGRPLFVTGHSLGAAIALATIDRAHMEKKLSAAQVFIFGSPRVGRADFVARYNDAFGSTTYRLVYGRDIVPTVPPSELKFHHVGRFLHCQGDAKFEEKELSSLFDSDEPTMGNNFFSGIAERLRGFLGFWSTSSRTDPLGQLSQLLAPSIGDHLPDRYYNALTKKA
jgi:Lipase (class 3)